MHADEVFCETQAPIAYFKKQNRNVKVWTSALKQFLSNRKEEQNCPNSVAAAHTYWSSGHNTICSVVYGPSITDVCLFFFYLFIFVPRKTNVASVPSKLDCLAICYQQSYIYETFPHLDFVSGKPLSILIPTWTQQNSQTHLDLWHVTSTGLHHHHKQSAFG